MRSASYSRPNFAEGRNLWIFRRVGSAGIHGLNPALPPWTGLPFPKDLARQYPRLPSHFFLRALIMASPSGHLAKQGVGHFLSRDRLFAAQMAIEPFGNVFSNIAGGKDKGDAARSQDVGQRGD